MPKLAEKQTTDNRHDRRAAEVVERETIAVHKHIHEPEPVLFGAGNKHLFGLGENESELEFLRGLGVRYWSPRRGHYFALAADVKAAIAAGGPDVAKVDEPADEAMPKPRQTPAEYLERMRKAGTR